MTKEELVSQFDILRTEYIKLLNDKDVLLQWGKPQLEAEEWVNEEVAKIETEIKELRAYEGELILEYESLINGYGGTKPELN